MSSKQFTALTFAFLRLVKSDHDLTALAVALQLTEHFNETEGGVARAGTQFMARQLGLSQPTVVRALHRLADRGRLRIEWGKQGRGNVNHCWMLVEERCAGASFGRAEKIQKKMRQRPKKDAPAHMNHLKNQGGASKEAPPLERERVHYPSPAAALDGAAGKIETSLLVSASATPEEEEFAALRAAWPRPFADDEAADRRAFAEARAIASVDQIVAGACAWAAAADAPRYLQPLAKFLAGRCWEKPPPQRGRTHPQHRRNGNKVDLCQMMLGMAAEFEDQENNAAWGHIQ
jgi:hypothetical protein